ncbi:hypothetical protein AVEN_94286-1 [Araneus ventricosus]|uniref:Uncharacterized protein n=1 Tax=Araneus ventricosus TaxID=182803 RepID=A0A4Y2IIE9_ARAVE|nr:hypothetical protein AVEN_94286-1 [Araneus ventricosus]
MQHTGRGDRNFSLVRSVEYSFQDMDAFKTKRKSLRTSFTVAAKNVAQHLARLEADSKDVDKLHSLHLQLNDKFSRLDVIRNKISSFFSGRYDHSSRI